MGLKRIKISELTLADSLKGLYTIGVKLVNGVQTSVKVSLEHIQTAYENAVTATNKANQAASKADSSRLAIEANELERQGAEEERDEAETLRDKAEEQRVANEEAREQASKKYLTTTGGDIVSTIYKFASINLGGDKGSVRFGIISRILGYGEFLIGWPWQSTEQKECTPYCLFATGAEMHDRMKLVRTGNATFDVYFEGDSGNDYCMFVYMGGNRPATFTATGVSAIPEEIYKESAYAPVYFGYIYGSLKGNADTATKATQDGNGNNIADTYLPKTGGTMSGALTIESNMFLKSNSTTRYLQIATVNNSGVAFTSRVYVDVNAGRGAFLQFINNGVAYELGVHTDGAPRYIKGGTIYTLYHAGNLGIATESKAGLVKSGNDVAVNGDGTLTVRNAATSSIKDQAGGWTLRDFVDEILGIISGGDGDDMSAAINNLRSSLAEGQANLAAFVGHVNAFLNDAGASAGVIDSWKEIESFLAGITDTETLTGLLADTLASAKSYADGKTANSVTMAGNAGATGRVLVSAAANKTAKDSGVLLSDLAKKTELPVTATKEKAGIVKIGYSENGNNYPVELDGNGQAYVNVPWENTTYEEVSQEAGGLMSALDKKNLDGILDKMSFYTKPRIVNFGNDASAKYVKLMTINVSGYQNSPLCFCLFGRNSYGKCDVAVKFSAPGSSSTGPTVNSFRYTGDDRYGRNLRLYKTSATSGVFELWCKNEEGYDSVCISEINEQLHASGTWTIDYTVSTANAWPTGQNYTEAVIGSVHGNLSGTAENAGKLGGYEPFTENAGDPSGHVPVVNDDGVMEVGRFLDFHRPGSTADYDLRLMFDETGTTGRSIKFPRASGYLSLGDEKGQSKAVAFANASDAINIDNYPQAEYGTVVIWYNRAEADGTPPGQEGIVYQTKYRSELGESGSTYVDCLTQLYVGSNGIKHRTVIDYDEAAPFDGVAWSGNSPQVIPVHVYQASGYIDLTGIAAQDIDTNKPVYVKDVYGGGSGLIPLSCTRNGSTMYITFTYFDTDYGTPVIAYKQISQSEFGKHVDLSFKEL